jgi:imidazolonepropionase-like amidohydrolase
MRNIFLTAATVAALTLLNAPARAQEEKPTYTLITNVNVFDGVNDRLTPGAVLIENNLIKSVGANVKAPEGTTIIDGGRRTLMPGMIDSHVHFNMAIQGGLSVIEASRWDRIGAVAASCAQEWLMDGFTTVRDMGGMGNGLKMTIDEGLLDGPRIYPSGSYISQTSGHGDLLLGSQRDPQSSNMVRLGIAQLADGSDAVRAAARKNIAEGATQLKIMIGGGISSEKGPLFAPQYSVGEIRAAVEEAETRETYVAVHVYHAAHIRRALELGVKSIEHGQFIDLPTAVLLKERGAFISPFVAGFSPESLLHPVYGKKGSPQNKKALEFQELSKNFVAIMKKVKPKVVFAIDVVNLTGASSRKNRDFEKFAFAREFGNFEALKSMTSVPGELAQLTGRTNPYPHKLGVIEKGAYADLLLVDGNPLEDITVIGANSKYFDAEPRGRGIKTIRLIMKDGKTYKNTLK